MKGCSFRLDYLGLSCYLSSTSARSATLEHCWIVLKANKRKEFKQDVRVHVDVTGRTRESGEDLDFILLSVPSLLMCHNLLAAPFSLSASPSFSLIMLGVMTGGHQIKGSGPVIITGIGYVAINILLLLK